MLIDIHCHLDHCYFKDNLDRVINNAKKAGLKVILTAGINPETNRKALELAEKYDIVKPCLGVYPPERLSSSQGETNLEKKRGERASHRSLTSGVSSLFDTLQKEIESCGYPLKENKFDVDEETRFIEKNKDKISAVGEVGLDYSQGEYPGNQKKIFKKMIALAEKLNKPLIAHSRKAEGDCIDILESSKLKKIIMHCFCGRKTLVRKIIDNGWFLTIPTNIVRSRQFQFIAQEAPITQLFCETDAPYLSPFRDKRNEPAFVAESYKKLVEIKGMESDEVVNNIWMNWQKTFQ